MKQALKIGEGQHNIWEAAVYMQKPIFSSREKYLDAKWNEHIFAYDDSSPAIKSPRFASFVFPILVVMHSLKGKAAKIGQCQLTSQERDTDSMLRPNKNWVSRQISCD